MEKKATRTALLITILASLITWTLWISSFFLNVDPGTTFLRDVFYTVKRNSLSFWLFSLAVYGPLISSIIFRLLNKEKLPKLMFLPQDKKWTAIAILFPFIVTLPIFVIVPQAVFELKSYVFYSILLLSFASNILTSAFEEPCWRGTIYPLFRANSNRWDAAFYSGLLWALWHYPYVIYQTGYTQILLIISTLAGFTIGIIGANYVFGYLYEKTKSIIILMIVHALMNAITLTLASIVNNPLVSVVPQVTVWIAVFLIDKFEAKDNGYDIARN